MSEVRILHGDCRAVMRTLNPDSVDAIVTDPPYGIGFMGKRWDSPGSFVERKPEHGNTFDHVGGNHNPTCPSDAARTRLIEGRKFGAWCETWATEGLRVLKPGGHLLAFSSTRTYHRLVCAVEDAGFEIRDMTAWLYGQGFPKSHNLADAWEGWGTALKPALEPIVLARKPLSEKTVAANVARWGTGALNIDGCRVPVDTRRPGRSNARSASDLTGTGGAVTYGAYAVRGSVAVEDTTLGRWPANVIHDGSQEVLHLFPETKTNPGTMRSVSDRGMYSPKRHPGTVLSAGDSGSAARFFPSFPCDDAPARYCPKAGKAERVSRCTSCSWRTMGKTPPACPQCGAAGQGTWAGHPTVKPVALMRWLCRLITRPGGTVLDPFAGSGTTLQAARDEGFAAIGIEREAEYVADARHRLGLLVPAAAA